MFFWRFRCCGFLSFLVPFALQKDEAVIPSHHQVNCNCCQHNSGHTTNNNDSDKEILWLLCFHWRLRPSTFHIFALQVIKKHFPLEFGHRVFLTKRVLSHSTLTYMVLVRGKRTHSTVQIKKGRGPRPQWLGSVVWVTTPWLGELPVRRELHIGITSWSFFRCRNGYL